MHEPKGYVYFLSALMVQALSLLSFYTRGSSEAALELVRLLEESFLWSKFHFSKVTHFFIFKIDHVFLFLMLGLERVFMVV